MDNLGAKAIPWGTFSDETKIQKTGKTEMQVPQLIYFLISCHFLTPEKVIWGGHKGFAPGLLTSHNLTKY